MLSESEAADLIRRNSGGLRVESLAFLGAGDFCVAFVVNDAWVFRFARHQQAAAALAREVCILPRLAERIELRIPRPEFVHLDAATPFMGYALLPGIPLTRERCLSLAQRELEWCAEQIARFLTQMHRTDLAALQACALQAIYDRAYYSQVLLEARRVLFRQLQPQDRAFVDWSISDFLDTPDPPGFRAVLLHGDFSPDHVLLDEETRALTGVIDFGDVGIGDPAWDFVFLYEDFGIELLARVARIYATDSSARAALHRRMHRFYVLGAIEWAVRASQKSLAELPLAIEQIAELRVTSADGLNQLLATCS
jgi:aminoglycoside 2''-phosphotransferase